MTSNHDVLVYVSGEDSLLWQALNDNVLVYMSGEDSLPWQAMIMSWCMYNTKNYVKREMYFVPKLRNTCGVTRISFLLR